MQSISTIIQKVQIDLNQLHDEKLLEIGQNLVKTNVALEKLSEQKFSLLDQRTHATSDKKKLKLQVSLNRLESYMSKLKSKIKINLEGLKNNTQIKSDTKKRILNILNEIDSSKSDALSNNQGDSHVALPSPTGDLGYARQAAIEGKHMAQDSQRQNHHSKANREETLYEKSTSLLNNQLDAIKKSKFFKTFFQIISPLIEVGTKALASLFTAGAGTILISNACSTAFQMLQSFILGGLDKKLENAKTAEKEIQNTIKSNEKTMQQLLKGSKKSEMVFHKAAKTLEYSQRST